MVSKEKVKYWAKYTGASYLDFFMSIPIGAAQGLATVSQKGLGQRTPKLLTIEDINENSPTYRVRKKLREEQDSRAGSVFIKNNLIGVIPFLLVGIPAAEGIGNLINHYMPNAPELVKCGLNSLGTLATQLPTGYATFMAMEIRDNKHKYVNESGRLSPKKIGQGIKRAVKAFLSFDLAYIASKLAGQTAFLLLGKRPAVASALFDGLAFPAWYTIGIPLGLEKGVITTRDYDKIKLTEEHNGTTK